MKRTFLEFMGYDAFMMLNRLKERYGKNKKSPLPHAVIGREALQIAVNKLYDRAYTVTGELTCTAYITKEPVSFLDRENGKKIELKAGDKWAEEVFDCAWMHFVGKAPNVAERETIVLLNVGGEGLVYDKDGREIQGITSYASSYAFWLGLPMKRVVFAAPLTDGDKLDFWVDAAANDLFGRMQQGALLEKMNIGYINPSIRGLAYDADILLSLYDYTSEKERNERLIADLKECLKDAKTITEEQAAERRAKLAHYFTEGNGEGAFEYAAIGHAHLDLGWLWPIRESYRKGARTFRNQLVNIGRFPTYVFGASQAQLYEWMKERYPMIYEDVKRQAKEGRWDVQGATWVEMDSNLVSGESLIRQFFYGKKFFKEEFQQDMQILWLPDSFGYSGFLPQVMKLSGVPYFMSQKMSWNRVNKFPYHTFTWAGLDGSEVFAHFPPEDTYNSPVNAWRLTWGERNYRERKISDSALSLFGIGDGGGGPGMEHIERMTRERDLKGLPKVTPMKSLQFFEKLSEGSERYPKYSGELYLEKHQGTLTTQGGNKRYNRRIEFALRNLELLSGLAIAEGVTLPIEKVEIDSLWREVLLYQFHDILPGSSINRVYTESLARYREMLERVEGGIRELLPAVIGGNVVNLNSFPVTRAVKLTNKWHRLTVPALGSAKVNKTTELKEFSASVTADTIENDIIKVRFDDGLIVSLYDKRLKREFVPEGKPMNLFSQYRDAGDAWDIRPVNYHDDRKKAMLASFSTFAEGALAYADIEFMLKGVLVKERVSLIDGSPLINIDLEIFNNQKCSMLRVEFPTTVETTECSFNYQFGHVVRPTTEKDSYDKAQFEVGGQKFVDLSDGSLGISLLNDCKYGYRCKHGVIDVDLIRNPKKGPSTEVDYGINSIKLALLPHMGGLGAETYLEAYLLNNPLVIAESSDKAAAKDMISISDPAIMLEGAKLSEDGKGLILHVYNSSTSPITADIALNGFKLVSEVGVMEDKLAPFSGNSSFRGFELKCLKFEFRKKRG